MENNEQRSRVKYYALFGIELLMAQVYCSFSQDVLKGAEALEWLVLQPISV